jgi:hypothetical protein
MRPSPRIALAALLAAGACRDTAAPTRPPTPPARAVAAAAGSEAAAVGRWDAPSNFPRHVAIHAHLLPTGRVLFWPGEEGPRHGSKGAQVAFIWDPATGASVQVDNKRTDVFCSGHAFLADGRLLVNGGHVADGVGMRHTNYFDPVRGQWSRGPDMAFGRWYPTSTVLANGDVLTAAGTNTGAGDPVRTPEVLTPGGAWRRLAGVDVVLPYYPWMFLAPNGKVFYAGSGNRTAYLDPAGAGRWIWDWTPTPYTKLDAGRDYGSAVMFAPGEVLIVGGTRDGTTPPTNTAERIDLRAAAPAWQFTGPMAFGRRHLNATLLPDGRVLATGGTSSPGFNNPDGSVHEAEVWNPATNAWTTWARMSTRRLYHSTALLLPDGRVLSAGGGRPAGSGGRLVTDDTDHPDAEVFSPPYLFNADGTPVTARPTVTGAPASVAYGQAIDVRTPDAARVARATLVRLGSVTHTFDQNQRFVPLAFTADPAANLVRVAALTDRNVVPPGHYMLFVLDGAGVPSVARIVRIG